MELGRRLSLGIGAASVLAGLSAWYALRAFHLVSPDLLASPQEVVAAFLDIVRNGYRETTLSQNIVATLGRCLIGFGAAVLLGVPLGLWMGMSRLTAASIDYIIQFLRPLPPLSYLVLLILWFGTGDLSKIMLLFMGAFPTITSAAMSGVRQVSEQRIQAARALGASSRQIFRHVVFPSALAEIFTGARLAIGFVYGTLIAAEIIAGSSGIGWMIVDAGRFLRSDYVFVGIFIIGLMGIALDRLLLVIERRAVHWAGK